MAGDCFEIRIKTCISHQGPGKARLNVSCIVHFLKGTWIRLAIEKAGPDALREYYSQLKDALEDKIKLEPTGSATASTTFVTNQKRPSSPLKDLWNSHKDSVVPVLALFISILTAVNFYVLFELQSALGDLRAIKAARDPPLP
jgi:hypothetical protein